MPNRLIEPMAPPSSASLADDRIHGLPLSCHQEQHGTYIHHVDSCHQEQYGTYIHHVDGWICRPQPPPSPKSWSPTTATSSCHLPSARLHHRPRNLHGLYVDLDQDPPRGALRWHHRLPSAEALTPTAPWGLTGVASPSVHPVCLSLSIWGTDILLLTG